ncbi:C40 family peptidase [Paraburkholderia sp. EG287A]|uniref:C40 family peptidase n=1 Tax=Paraburkholderia sp. EG287A TaxID=3237012 RepID=UPI0034D1534C
MQALSLLKNGYKWGGKSLNTGLDCSGLVSYVYRTGAGMRVGPNTTALAKTGHAVSKQQLHAGDLVFFNTLHHAHSAFMLATDNSSMR